MAPFKEELIQALKADDGVRRQLSAMQAHKIRDLDIFNGRSSLDTCLMGI